MLGRGQVEARRTISALRAAVERRRPAPGLTHHTDRGSPYATEAYRKVLAEHGLVSSIGRRGNPYDSAKAESFMKALEVEMYGPGMIRQSTAVEVTIYSHS
ncbi:DDE-type integrase/transposase/recombinase [Methylobacterium sp. P31]